MHEVERHVTVEKSRMGRHVYAIVRFGMGQRELQACDIYVDLATHVLISSETALSKLDILCIPSNL
jgi:hypothetical protein